MLKLRRRSSAAIVELDPGSAMGAGGEARVFPVPSDPALVAKVYRRPTAERARKLAVMLANPPDDPMAAHGHVSVAWPVDLLETPEGGQIVGFLMPRAAGTRPIVEFYNPMSRRRECPLFTYQYLYRTARNLGSAIRAIHARGYVIGDVNESNMLVTDTALVTLVDTDSFQVRDPESGEVFRCPVGRPEFTPAEIQGQVFRDIDRAIEHDLFGLAVLLFLILMEGTHPYAGIYTAEGDPPAYSARILDGHFPYGTKHVPYRPMPVAPPFEILPPAMRGLFIRCFEDGFADPQARPTAGEWVDALQDAECALVACPVNEQHRYGAHLPTCPWCERTRRLGGRDPFPSRSSVALGYHLAPPTAPQTPLPAVERIERPPDPIPVADPVRAAPSPVIVPVDLPPPAENLPPPPIQPRPIITTAPRIKPARVMPTRILRAAALTAVGLVVLAGLVLAGLGKAAANGYGYKARRELGRARIEATSELTAESISMRRRTVSGGILFAQEALKGWPWDKDARDTEMALRKELVRVDADSEALAARGLLKQVTDAIERYKNRTLTESEASTIKDELRSKCRDAISHTDRALALDDHCRAALVERVRAYHLMADDSGASAALQQALALYPDDKELKSLRSMVANP